MLLLTRAFCAIHHHKRLHFLVKLFDWYWMKPRFFSISLCNSQFAWSLISRRKQNQNLIPRLYQSQLRTMMKKRDPGENHKPVAAAVSELQQLLDSTDSGGGWDRCWEEGVTPWDLGRATPVIAHLHKSGALPKGRALVPGCGTGYDVVEIACPERHVIGLDISHNAINKAIQLFSSLPNAMHFTFLKVDFFTWHPTDLFDLIFDYTFFCAIEPDMRLAWAQKMADILKPDGELITLMFPIDDHVGGPPYKVSVSDYEEVLHPMGFKAISILDNDLAVQPRKGREKLGRWKRYASRSSL